MRDIEIVESTSSAYTHLLNVGGREDGTGGAMALGFTYEEIYRIFKEAQKEVAKMDPDASIDIHEEFNKLIEDLNDTRDKLEAIKTLRSKKPKWSRENIVYSSYVDQWFDELDEILGADDDD